MGRPPCCDKSNVKRGLWTAEEDAKILAYVSNHGIGNWTSVPKKAGLNRCGKSCRLRWTNYLRPDLKHDSFTAHEEELIIHLHKLIGSRWSLIAKHLPGRTDNDVKNCWNTRLRKKLQKMGIDPITHRPISQVLSDYGNISALPNSENPLEFFRNDLNDPSQSGQEQSSIKNAIPRNNIEEVNVSSANFPLWDFLPQFQVTNQENFQAHFLNEVTSSCSSSSSCSTPLRHLISPQSSSCQPFQAKPPQPNSSFCWSEFLLCDPILPGTSSSDSSLTGENARNVEKFEPESVQGYDSLAHEAERATIKSTADASSSSATSFVDSILDKDGEMRSQFPQLLDASFDYC